MKEENVSTALVIASNREDHFRDWYAAWMGKDRLPWDVTILVQDGEEARWCNLPEGIIHYTWEDIAGLDQQGAHLPEWLSRNDSGIKAYGFLKAATEWNARTILTLDDDCYPSPRCAPARCGAHADDRVAARIEAGRGDFVDQHLAAIYETPLWTSTIPGFVPRGLPYFVRGTHDVVLNMGIWDGIPDRDAVHELTNYTSEELYKPWWPRKADYRHTRVMSPRQFWPLCGMNLAFDMAIAPLMYFPRMGDGVMFRRFDDIWCGVIAQRCLRQLGLACGVGRPIVTHRKASSGMVNLVKEAPGIRAHEEFWQVIDKIPLGGATTPLGCMRLVAAELTNGYCAIGVQDPLLRSYLPNLGSWIGQWCDEFTAKGWK